MTSDAEATPPGPAGPAGGAPDVLGAEAVTRGPPSLEAQSPMDRAQFDRVFAEFAPRVRAYLIKHGVNPSVAEEIVQEVMVTLWHNAARYDPAKGSMSTWIFTIARNRLIDSVRRQKRPEPDPDDPCWVGDRQSDSPTPESATHALVRARGLRSALAELPAEQRRVLEGLYFDGLSMSELAEATGIPLGTIKTRARLALRTLRQYLGSHEREASDT